MNIITITNIRAKGEMSVSAFSNNTQTKNINGFVKTIAIGLAVGMIAILILLAVFAIVMTLSDMPPMAITIMAVSAVGAGGFASGYTSAKIARASGLIKGAICGALLSLLTIFIGAAFLGETMGTLVLIKITVIIVCASLGGVMGVNAKIRRRKK